MRDRKRGSDIKDMNFNNAAAKYDNLGGRLSRRFYRLLLEQVDLTSDMSVLDVGCGTGTILRAMSDFCSIKGFGIDMSENMIEEAKRKCPEMDIRLSRCEETPFEDDTFDVVTTCMAYHHFSDKAGFAREAARILKLGGCLYIADPSFPGVARKMMNTVSRLLNIAGEFFTPEEIFVSLSVFGFQAVGYKKDSYAQLVKLRLSGS